MGLSSATAALLCLVTSVTAAGCPFADPAALHARQNGAITEDILAEYKVDDSTGFLTDDVGGQIGDQHSLKAGKRGPTLLEDFIFRQKITHFDHERVRLVVICDLAIMC